MAIIVVKEEHQREPDPRQRSEDQRASLASQLAASALYMAPIAPTVAAIVTVFAYEAMLPALPSGGPRRDDVMQAMIVQGLLLAALVWGALTLGHAALGLSRRDRINATSYRRLTCRADELEAMALSLDALDGGDPDSQLARREFARHLADIRTEMQHDGPQWMMGHAYIDLWRRMHRAEEAWLTFAPEGAIRASLDTAQISLTESKMEKEQRQQIEDHLKLVTDIFFPESPDKAAQQQQPAETSRAKSVARSRLAVVWKMIHDYRDDRWDGLLTVRNRLLLGMGVCSTLIYGIVCLAIIADLQQPATAEQLPLFGGLALCMFAGLVGLLAQLTAISENTRSVDDYGLTNTQLAVSPVLSGLAAIIGLGVIAAMYSYAHPTTSTDPTAVTVFNLKSAFELNNATNLLLAAALGYSPKILLDRIKTWSETVVTEVNATQAGEKSGS